MDYLRRFAEASRKYRPAGIKLLFIAEAPPAFKTGRFFYFTGLTSGDTLFLEMMKVLYPTETGFLEGDLNSGFEPKRVRLQKELLLERFKHDGFYLIDAHEQPMPDGADAATKKRLMQSTLPALRRRVRKLCNDHSVPAILIGDVTYTICAEALRTDGTQILNKKMIDHPARGGQIRFRAKLSETIGQFLPLRLQ